MTAVSMVLMALGVSFSAIGGLTYQHGSHNVLGHVDWIPHAGLMLANPGVAFALGVAMIVSAIVCQARRYG